MEKTNIVNELNRFESDFLFFQKEIGNIREHYLNKFVAISDKKIVASGTSIQDVEEKLRQKNLDISKIVVEFVPEEETFMVL